MAYNNYQQAPFWDFVRSFDHQNGAGVDHPVENFPFFGPPPGQQPYGPPHGAGFPFDGSGWGRGGFGAGPRGRGRRGGRHHRRDGSHERSPHGSRDGSPNPEHHDHEEHGHGHHGPRGPGCHGRGRRGGWGGWARGGHRGPPPPGPPGGFDLSGLFESLSAHPLAQAFRTYAEQAGAGAGAEAQRSGETPVPEDNDNEKNFSPPIDVFSTEKEYVLHVSLPGAKKEDVGVNWDEDKGVLNIAGVVYRHGDEEFLKTLATSERKVGVFERTVKLPPGDNEEKEEIDADGISAKLEDGVLVVTIPKVEKEWTEVKRVDIK
ncbi:Heat shock protein [Lachnellula occidentalis]|uniref:Heat shock protein n=1 Tax=Lachnellula occidentalis TaxID=215460 RepID=A0A8H8S149_9HELO|nr:Heat shock protein [Lachnellula occidentalis]